jgi:pantothenate kinase
LLDESWFIAPPEDVRQERLIRRHELYGLSKEQARDWALGSDERNARLVAETRGVADLVARVRDIPLDSTSNADPAETTKKGQL